MRPLTSLLVANRGEIARRIFRTARAMGLRCIAVYVEADAYEPFVREADEALLLAGGTYLGADAILEIARAAGADAIHPGYGFLSENAEFASAVIDAGLAWVGPSPVAIESMGDKIAAKRVAVEAGVPTLPSSEDPTGDNRVGYPLLVKAAAGGGGKGMRVVWSPTDLPEAVTAAQREAQSGFGDDRVFLERYVARSRHVEIQILGDSQGSLVHLGERECSIQRRHQKIIEESPSPIVDAEMRRAMGEAALRLAKAIDYESAGTVEFLVDEDTRDFYFLEVNTRIQVEHPVTEEVTGVDLVREQLRVAAGAPLDFSQEDISFRGHAIEARLYAEDPAAGFLPAAGELAAFYPSADPVVRWDSGVECGSTIGVEFDPMMAKVIAHAPTRLEAAGRLALALERLHLAGLTTNRAFLVNTLRDPAFLAGDTTTDFIERVAPSTEPVLEEGVLERAQIAAALWLQGSNRADAPVLGNLPSGWRNGRMPAQRVEFVTGEDQTEVRYQATPKGFQAWVGGGTAQAARILSWTPDEIDIEVGGRRTAHRVTHVADSLFVQVPRGTLQFGVVSRFVLPGAEQAVGAVLAPMPGVVIAVRVAPGDTVAAGDVLVILEAMKMEHHLKAPSPCTVVEVRVQAGEHVQNGTTLLVLDEESQE